MSESNHHNPLFLRENGLVNLPAIVEVRKHVRHGDCGCKELGGEMYVGVRLRGGEVTGGSREREREREEGEREGMSERYREGRRVVGGRERERE